MSENGSSVLSASVQCLATLLAVMFVETAGRKLLLITSALIMALAQGGHVHIETTGRKLLLITSIARDKLVLE